MFAIIAGILVTLFIGGLYVASSQQALPSTGESTNEKATENPHMRYSSSKPRRTIFAPYYNEQQLATTAGAVGMTAPGVVTPKSKLWLGTIVTGGTPEGPRSLPGDMFGRKT